MTPDLETKRLVYLQRLQVAVATVFIGHKVRHVFLPIYTAYYACRFGHCRSDDLEVDTAVKPVYHVG